MKKIIFGLFLVAIIFSLGKDLNPFSKNFFPFHDETQPARIQEFNNQIKKWHFPPRMARNFSFQLGYPVFNFYSPTAYWITSGLSFTGLDTIASLKISFLLTLVIGFLGTFFLAKYFFSFYPALFSAVLYVTSLYFPVDIFVRGNLSESWFLALFPLVIYLLLKNKQKRFFITTITLSLLFTSHNLLSLISIPIILVIILFSKKRVLNFTSFFLAVLLSGYFWIPMFIEMPLVWAKEIASRTNYQDHFLCPFQLWQSNWGFGGSEKGCIDGMSFKIGKPQIIFYLFGFISLVSAKIKKEKKYIFYLLALLSSGSLFMTTYLSSFIWKIFPFLAVVQFPWRFISFSLLGIAIFGGLFFNQIKFTGKNILIILLSFFLIFYYGKYYRGQKMSNARFKSKFLSQKYIKNEAAFGVAEYLPKTADYGYWRKLGDNPKLFEKKRIDIHYFPYWEIYVNGKSMIPTKFDLLGRPIIKLKKNDKISLQYRQTDWEKFGNLTSFLAILALIFISSNKTIWKKIKNMSI